MDTSSLKESWATVRESGDKVPQYFYSHLFVSHPELRAMFPIQMSGQRDKLVAALGTIVSNVDTIDEVIAVHRAAGSGPPAFLGGDRALHGGRRAA